MAPRQPPRPSTVRQIFTRSNVRSALFRRSLPPGLARHAGRPVLAYRPDCSVTARPPELPDCPSVAGDETAEAE